MTEDFSIYLEPRISPRIFEKIWNGPNGILRGLGETDSWKKTRSRKSRNTVPLKHCIIHHLPSRCKLFKLNICCKLHKAPRNNTFRGKKGTNPSVRDPWHFGTDPYLWLTDADSDLGGPKTYGSWFGFGTLVHLHHSSKIKGQKEVTEQWKSRFVLLFLLDNGKIRSRFRTCD
jgi:hypothetical protein